MTIRIVFMGEVFVNGDTLAEIKNKWENMPLFCPDALNDNDASVTEVVLCEDADTFKTINLDSAEENEDENDVKGSHITTCVDGTTYKTFGLTKELHDIAVKFLTENKRKIDNYTLEELDGETVNVWIADAHAEGQENFAEFLRLALANNGTVYTLKSHVGDFSQSIGELAVY